MRIKTLKNIITRKLAFIYTCLLSILDFLKLNSVALVSSNKLFSPKGKKTTYILIQKIYLKYLKNDNFNNY